MNSAELRYFIVAFYGILIDVKLEKKHNDFIHGVENFSTNKLKHTDTLEKVILPNADGTYFLWLLFSARLHP